jgi:histidine kinase/DNA gyrase B/HSP90-like ATPase
MTHVDLTPDPRVLIALTHTPLQPLDALCELIDNAIDSFATARLAGSAVSHPLVLIEIPGSSEVIAGEGAIRVRDNGSGLTLEMAEKALRAGFSGNRPFDSLGLFGMGFNIATGKLGRKTRFVTAQTADSAAIEVVIDLVELQEKATYLAPVEQILKPPEFTSGTVVEVSGWWPEGNPNSGFIRKLASYPKPTIRQEIGRRYASILGDSENPVRIKVNGEPCVPFEHCVWTANRAVERRGHGKIPARFDFNQVIATQVRCSECHAQLIEGETVCPSCGSSHLRTLEERIRGWVGIQRFDHETDFGIDLIRNGRAVRVWEQQAFFEYTDELKKVTKDYPIDSPFGRIVGQVHLSHVPVDFLKQDFQRSSPEWQRAMSFLRGESSLQPTQPGAGKNQSPVFKLYQGYRKVRNPGTSDMYMGVWDAVSKKPKRVSRDVERDFYQKFQDKLPGYYDEAEWWKLVEQADHPPLEELVECPSCSAQNLKEHEECDVCGEILIGKSCLNPDCQKKIPQSAVSCPHCGVSQIPQIEEPWACQVCSEANNEQEEVCGQCGYPRGTKNFGSRDFLSENSDKDDDLSLWGVSLDLADGTQVTLNVSTYVTRQPITPVWQGASVPALTFRGETIEVFLDKTHPLFASFGVRPEEILAAELAYSLYSGNSRLLTPKYQGYHTISTLFWSVLEGRWADQLEDSPQQVHEDIRRIFDVIRERLPLIVGSRAPDIFDDLTDDQKKALVDGLIGYGHDIAQLGEMKKTGEYLTAVDEATLVDLFRKSPEWFFDGGIWSVPYKAPPELSDMLLDDYQRRIRVMYGNCLEDCAAFLHFQNPEHSLTSRARASADFLLSKFS